MSCGCGQRRVIGAKVVAAMKGGDFQEARRQMREMASSGYQDLSRVMAAPRRGYARRRDYAPAEHYEEDI